MTAADFFAASRVLIVAGKGGVGKSTVGATLGVAASRLGSKVLLVELEGHSALGVPFGLSKLPYEGMTIEQPEGGGRLQACQITPDTALYDYLEAGGLNHLTKRLARSGALDLIAAAAPGIRDLLALGKIRQIEQAGEHDLIIVDAPAAGHAMTFLRSPVALARSAGSGPIRHQADLVLEMFRDEERCRVMLVTLPEEAPVTEVIETAFKLEEKVGLELAPLVVNSCWPVVQGLTNALERAVSAGRHRGVAPLAARYRIERIEEQEAERERLRRELPLSQIEVPFLFSTDVDRMGLSNLADAVVAQLDSGLT